MKLQWADSAAWADSEDSEFGILRIQHRETDRGAFLASRNRKKERAETRVPYRFHAGRAGEKHCGRFCGRKDECPFLQMLLRNMH